MQKSLTGHGVTNKKLQKSGFNSHVTSALSLNFSIKFSTKNKRNQRDKLKFFLALQI